MYDFEARSTNEKQQYFPPCLDIFLFASEDIITTSQNQESEDDIAEKCFGGKIYWDD